MSDTTKRLRAELVLDTSKVDSAQDRLQAGFQRSTVAAQRLRDELDRLEQSRAGPSPTTTMLAQIERDLGQPIQGPKPSDRLQMHQLRSLENQWAFRDLARLEQMVSPVLDELDLMDAAFGAVQKSDREAERTAKKAEVAAKRSKGVWGDFSESIKKGAKSTFQPLTDMGSAVLEVGKGLGVIGGVAYGVVSAIDAIADAFSRSQETVDAYADAVKGLPQELQNLRRESEEFWAKQNRIDKLPGFSGARGIRRQIEEITGTQDNNLAPGEAGKAQSLLERRTSIENFILMQQKEARSKGLEVDASGNLRVPADFQPREIGGFYRTRQNLEWSRDMLMQNRYTTSDGKQTGDYQNALTELARLDAQLADMGSQAARLEKDKEKAFIDGIKHMEREARSAFERIGSNIAGIGDRVGGAFSSLGEPGTWLSAARAEEQRKKDMQALWKFIATGELPSTKTNIDARGAKITVNTQVKTDDPARFADVALKSAFIGVAARPLSATMGLGAPMVGGARRP